MASLIPATCCGDLLFSAGLEILLLYLLLILRKVQGLRNREKGWIIFSVALKFIFQEIWFSRLL